MHGDEWRYKVGFGWLRGDHEAIGRSPKQVRAESPSGVRVQVPRGEWDGLPGPDECLTVLGRERAASALRELLPHARTRASAALARLEKAQTRGPAAPLPGARPGKLSTPPRAHEPPAPNRTDTVRPAIDAPARGTGSPVSVPSRPEEAAPRGGPLEIALVLLDLDNTLLPTDHLKIARERRDQDAVERALATLEPYAEVSSALAALQARHARLGVVTRAPRWYAERLLAHCLPGIRWSAVVCYDDVIRQKPDPAGIRLACKQAGLACSTAVVFVGDDADDLRAAYHAGARPVLAGWHAASGHALPILPEAMLASPRELVPYCTSPDDYLPLAERAAEGAPHAPVARRVYGVEAHSPGPAGAITVLALGRYYPKQGATLGLHAQHRLSLDLRRKEQQDPCIPDYWVSAIEGLIVHELRDDPPAIITVIPAKTGRPRRMEELLRALAARLDGRGQARCDAGVLRFADGATSIKTEQPDARRAAVAATLELGDGARSVQDRSVLLIDDVLTTGATLAVATALLKGAGARAVVPVALGRTISLRPLEPPRICPRCGRPMQLRVNGKDGSQFWGCSGYRSGDCDETIDCAPDAF